MSCRSQAAWPSSVVRETWSGFSTVAGPVGDEAQLVGARGRGAPFHPDIGVVGLFVAVALQRIEARGDVEHIFGAALEIAERGIEQAVRPFVRIGEAGIGRRGDGEVERLLRLPERAHAGIEREAEGLGVGLFLVIEAEQGVGIVARARRGIVEIVVAVPGQGARRPSRSARRTGGVWPKVTLWPAGWCPRPWSAAPGPRPD